MAEVIDGELVVMNLASGSYYSSQGLGAAIWGWIETGHAIDAIRDSLVEHFEAPAADVERDLSAFCGRLREEGLVRVEEAPAATGAPAVDASLRYEAPTLMKYEDMQDLLLLDPIHDVDETGWPTLPPAE
ncbi:MAG: PqqD family protein [Alphaproteobacteria bacterium]